MDFSINKLGDLCTITSSKRIFAKQYVEFGIPFYRSKEIIEKNQNQTISDPLFISEELFKKIKSKFGIPQKGDLLLTSVGTLGIPYIVKDETFYFKDGNLTWMKQFNNYVNSKYVYFWLTSQFGHDSLVSRAIGSSQGAITIDILKKYKLFIPSIKYQDAIVYILSRYDKFIENNNKRIKILEQIAENIYKEWFVRFRFPGYKDVEFVDGIPKGWEYKKFSSICKFVRGISYSSEEISDKLADTLLINLKNIRDFGGIRKENYKTYAGKYKDEQILKKFDLVMAITEMVQERRIIGYSGLIPTYKQNAVFSSDLIKIISDIDNIFLYSMFTYGGVSKCFSQYGNGTNVIHLKPSSLRNINLLIPTNDIIKRYVLNIKNIFNLIDVLTEQNENLIQQRDALLPKLMSGKIDIEKTQQRDTIDKTTKILTFTQFKETFYQQTAARAKGILDEDIQAAYEAYVDDRKKKK